MPSATFPQDFYSLMIINISVFSAIFCSYFLYKKFFQNRIFPKIGSRTQGEHSTLEAFSKEFWQKNGTDPSGLSFSAVFQVLCSALDLSKAALLQYDSQNKKYFVYAAFGENNFWTTGQQIDVQMNYGHAALMKEKLVAIDYAALSEWKNHASYKTTHCESYLSIPVYKGGQVFGALCVYDTKAKSPSFTKEDIAFAKTSAHWLECAIEVQAQSAQERFKRAA